MYKKIKKIMNFLLFVVIFALSTNVFATSSDNDGSAFISKAEFDSIKNSFLETLNRYNNSIDTKIDDAIARYLEGVVISNRFTQTIPFGAGEKAVVVNTTNIDNLQGGIAGINYLIDIFASSTYGGFIGSAQFNMKRDHREDYEIFYAPDGKFNWYSQKAYLDIESYFYFKYLGNLDIIRTTTIPNFRWHAGAYVQSTNNPTQRKRMEEWDFSTSASSVVYWDDRPNRVNYYFMYGTNYNLGYGFWSTSNIYRDVSTIFALDSNTNNKIKYIFDDSGAKSSVWINDLNKNKDDVMAYTHPKWITYAPASKPDAATYPVTTIYTAVSAGANQNLSASGTHSAYTSFYQDQPITWTTDGAYNTTTGANNCGYWYELVIDPATRSTIMKNSNVDVSGTKYESLGYQGNNTDGLPLGIFDGKGTVSFDLDLSTMEGTTNIYFAIANNTFSYNTNWASYSLPLKTTINVDGTVVSSGAVLLDKKKHKIVINFDYAKSTPIYFKFGLTNPTSKERAIITLPKDYQVVST